MKKDSGFTAFEGIIVVLVVAILAGVSYFIVHKQLQKLPASSASTNPAHGKVSAYKSYTNPQYKFSFKYPTTWKLTTKLEDIGRGGPEGDIYVTSPNGTKVHFGPNFGGKGGDCFDVSANKRTTKTCTTRKILSVKKLTNSAEEKIWLIQASDTAPTDNGGNTTYRVYLSGQTYDDNGNLVAPAVKTELGAFLGTYDDVLIKSNRDNPTTTYLTVYIEGKDDSKNSTSSFFNTKEVREALPVLESFKVD